MKKLIEEFGAQLQKALEIASAVKLQPAENAIHHVLLAGDGSAQVSAYLVAALAGNELNVPLSVISDELPAYVGKHTLLVTCAFSGNAEKYQALINSARAKGAKVVVISTDTQLLDAARANSLDMIALPADVTIPAISIGYMIVPALAVLHHYGLISDRFKNDITAAVSMLSQEVSEIRDRAKTLAFNFSSHLPVLYIDRKLQAVAVRAQQQVNLNAKHFCHINALQELDQHEIAGWKNPASILRNSLVVLISTNFDGAQAQSAIEKHKSALEKETAMVMDLDARGNSLIAQALYLIHVFDWTSLYLAELNDVDLSK